MTQQQSKEAKQKQHRQIIILNKFVEEKFRQEFSCITGEGKGSNPTPGFEEFIAKHLFFATVTFSLSQGHSARSVDSCLYSFRGLNYRLVRQLIGSHSARKTHLHPFIFFSLDDEGSRHGSVNLAQGNRLHIHALVMVHPDTMDKWNNLNWPTIQGDPAVIDSLRIEAFDASKASLPQLTSYISKALWPERDNDIYYDFYPEDQAKRRSTQVSKMKAFASSSQLQIQKEEEPAN